MPIKYLPQQFVIENGPAVTKTTGPLPFANPGIDYMPSTFTMASAL